MVQAGLQDVSGASSVEVSATRLAFWGWASFSVAIALSVVFGGLVGVVTTTPARPLGGTYMAVLGIAVGIPCVCIGPVLIVAWWRSRPIGRLAVLLAVAVVLGGVWGLVWVSRWGSLTLVVEAVALSAFAGWWTLRTIRARPLLPSDPDDWLEHPRHRPTTGQLIGVIVATAALMAGTAAILACPDPLGLAYRGHDEAQANRFLPEAKVLAAKAAGSDTYCYRGPGLPTLPDFGVITELCGDPHSFSLDSFSSENSAGWSLGYNSKGQGVCGRHLDGPWWESYGGTDILQSGEGCPWGLHVVATFP